MSKPNPTVVWKRTPEGPVVVGPAVNPELQREREIVQQENRVFEDAYKRGIISKSEYENAKATQAARLKDDKGVPVDTPLSKQTTAYLASEGPFYQKDVGAVILPKQGVVFGGQFYDVEVPKNMVITKVAKGEPVVEKTQTPEGEMTTTSTPLTLSFSMDPNYKLPPVPTEKWLPTVEDIAYGINPMNWGTIIGEAFSKPIAPPIMGSQDPFLIVDKYQSQQTRATIYAKETGLPKETALSMVRQADLQQDLTKLALVGGVVSFVAAPAVAAVGAVTSLGISQGIKGVTQGEVLTAEEAIFAGGLGASFSVAGSAVTGAATKAVPVLAEQTVKGAVSRVAFQTGVGAVGGASISGGMTAAMGGTPEQILQATGEGALYGGIMGGAISTGFEVYNVAKPWINRGLSSLKDTIQPERAMYNRVVIDQPAQAQQANAKEWGNLSFSDKIKGVFNPKEAAMYRQTQPLELSPKSTAKGPSFTQKVGDFLRPESAMFRRVTGTSPTDTTTLKPTSSPDTYYSGGKFVPFTGGKGGLSSVLIVKQKPVTAKPMSAMPIQKTSWTAGLMAVELKPFSVKTEQVTKQTVKTVPKTIVKTTPSILSGTSEFVGVNPMTYQGSPFPMTKRKGAMREEYATVVLDYPKSGLGHPPKMAEVLDLSSISQIGQGSNQALATKPIVTPKLDFIPSIVYGTKGEGMSSSLLDTSLASLPKSVLDTKGGSLVDTASITDLTQATQTQQTQVQDLTQGLQQKEVGRQLQRGAFEIGSLEGFTRYTPILRTGVGRQKRLYPILTGEDILAAHLGIKSRKKSIKKRKSKGGYKVKKGKGKK